MASGTSKPREIFSAEAAFTAFEVLFAQPDSSGCMQMPDDKTLRLTGMFIRDFTLPETLSGHAKPGDYLNAIACCTGINDYAATWGKALLEALLRHRVLPDKLAVPEKDLDENTIFLLNKALILSNFLRNSVKKLKSSQKSRMLPGCSGLFAGLPADLPELTDLLRRNDPFTGIRSFSYRNGKFIPAIPDSVKPVSKFFGFPGVRSLYADHFAAFAAGRSNLPLLINSLPGYGKTSMVLSFAMAHDNLIAILPEPDALEENWCPLIEQLAARRDLKFVIIFDDIDPRQVNWYSFRTHVGGAFTPPDNVMPVLVANYDFPPSILSRGRKITYPVFDELRCTEMVEDFLKSFGMRHPPANLVSLIGADYTEEFAQKKFTELSPRTLMRYLKIYETDQNKRRLMVELSSGELITRPDAELFYEFNIGLMRSLYGEEYIKNLLKERLKEL